MQSIRYQETNTKELRPLQKSVKFFITLFSCILFIDIIGQFCVQSYGYMTSSIITLSGLLVSRILIKFDKYELSILVVTIVFFIVGFFHTIALGNYTTCYFVLIAVPIVSSVLLENLYNKIGLIIASALLFPLCNYFAGLGLLENYFFYYGMFPTSLLMLHFYNKMVSLTEDKNKLIEKLEGKNDEILLFSNMMSHDLKAPLRSIGGFSALLQRKLKGLSEKDSELFTYIIDGVSSMRNLIDNLLQYSKFSINEFSFKEIDLDKLIKNLISTFNYDIKKDNVEIITKNLSIVNGHEESIYLLFQNLVSNSIKFQPKDDSHRPCIEISQIKETDKDIIVIKDNGIGIDEKYLSKIFTPFERFHSNADYEGTGLGMSIVSKIIEKHQGTVCVQSALGKGSTVTITLPLIEA